MTSATAVCKVALTGRIEADRAGSPALRQALSTGDREEQEHPLNPVSELTSARPLAERIMAAEAAGAVTAEDWLGVSARVDDKLMTALSPVLGDVGVHALTSRSLKKLKPQFPILAGVTTGAPPDKLREQLRAVLSGQDPTMVKDLFTASLAGLYQLMSTFIGEGLTRRLIKSTWPQIVIVMEPDAGETA